MVEQTRADEHERRAAGRATSSSATPAGSQEEGYWAYMQRQVQERTEKLGIMGDSMDRLEENSSGWANDVSKYVSSQKRKVMLGGMRHPYHYVYHTYTDCFQAVTSKFGL